MSIEKKIGKGVDGTVTSAKEAGEKTKDLAQRVTDKVKDAATKVGEKLEAAGQKIKDNANANSVRTPAAGANSGPKTILTKPLAANASAPAHTNPPMAATNRLDRKKGIRVPRAARADRMGKITAVMVAGIAMASSSTR